MSSFVQSRRFTVFFAIYGLLASDMRTNQYRTSS
jgi:hypothetical protein